MRIPALQVVTRFVTCPAIRWQSTTWPPAFFDVNSTRPFVKSVYLSLSLVSDKNESPFVITSLVTSEKKNLNSSSTPVANDRWCRWIMDYARLSMVWKVCVTIYTCRIYIEPWGWWRDRTGGLGSHDGVFWFESCGENTRLFGKVGMKHLTPLRYDLRFRLESTRQANSPTKCNAFTEKKVLSTPTRSSLLGKTTFFRPLSDYVPSNNCRKAFFNFRAPPPIFTTVSRCKSSSPILIQYIPLLSPSFHKYVRDRVASH